MSIIKKIIIFIIALIMIILVCVYEVYISYNKLMISNYTLNTKKINQEVNIVVISDLHENEFAKDNEELIRKIKNQSPDVILVVGDMVNKDSTDHKIVIDLMKELTKISRVFYSLGNTEITYMESNGMDILDNLKSVGVKVLDNSYEDIKIKDTVIRIGGTYEYAFGLKYKTLDKDSTAWNTYEFLSDFEDTDNYKIMMAHRPDSFIFNYASEDWDIDLVVSGHTHGGQVVVPLLGGLYAPDQGWFPKYDKGSFDLDNMKMIITSGLGADKQKLPRFNNVPEIVNIKIEND